MPDPETPPSEEPSAGIGEASEVGAEQEQEQEPEQVVKKGPRTRWGWVVLGLLWVVTLWLAGAVLYLSWIPDSRMELVPWIPRWLAGWADSGGEMQTARTAIPMAGLGLLLALSWRMTGWRYWMIGGLAVALLLLGLAEAGQQFQPRRSPDLFDFWWGAGGAAGGIVLAALLVACVRLVR